MKEENEYLEGTDNSEENNTVSSSSSLPKNNAKNIVNFNKYKSRKNNSDSTNTNKSSNTNINNNNSNRNRPLNGLKNHAFNKLSNAHPALKALSVLNNTKKMVGRSRNPINSGGIVGNTSSSDEQTNTTDSVASNNLENNKNTNETSNVSEDDNKSINPLSSIFKKDKNITGKFSFFGKMPFALRIFILLAPLVFIIFIVLIPITAIGLFSGFFGMDEVVASNGAAGNIDYGDYELSSDGDEILHESLDSFLESKGTSLEEFNNLIASNVENSGYGTDAGVVAAAVTLIAELGNNYDVKIPYFWGGGHGQMISGAAGNWGSNQCRASANGRIYDYCGLDCSGFAAWAIYNGGFKIAARTAGNFQNLPGAERVSLSSSTAVLAPGDLLESNSHIVIVIGVDEDTNEYICAEASGYTTGVLFTRRPFSRSGYWGVKMAGFYEGQVRS